MQHFDIYMKLKESSGQAPLKLELTATQRLEISHYVNNPLCVLLATLEQIKRDGLTDGQRVDRAERAALRIRDYIKSITAA